MHPNESLSYPIHIFYSYAQEDESQVNKLEKHLSVSKWQEHIITWHKRNISPGRESSSITNINLNTADIILLIVSADFLASAYHYGKEMQHALQRHEEGTACVVPILLRSVDWENAPFSKLQALPSNGISVSEWPLQEAAFVDIVQGIRKVIDELRALQPKERPHQEQPDPQSNWLTLPPSAFRP